MTVPFADGVMNPSISAMFAPVDADVAFDAAGVS
jgi:hypothetical protein